MVASVTHSKVSAKGDDADATLVRPSDWNAGHVVTGVVEQLASGNFAGAANLNLVLTAYTAYRALKFLLTNLTVSDATITLQIRTSTDGGVSYDSGAGNYNWSYLFSESNAAGVGTAQNNADTSIQFAYASNSVGDNAELEVTLFNQATALRTGIRVSGAILYAGRTFVHQAAGFRLASADVDAISFYPSAGTFSGNYAVYGMP